MGTPRVRWSAWLGAAVAVLALAAMAPRVAGPWLSGRVRAEAIALLESRLDGTVTIDALEIVVWPRLAIEGRGLRLERDVGQHTVPFLSIGHFTAAGGVAQLWRRRVDVLTVDEVTIVVVKGKRERKRGRARAPKDVTIGRIELANGQLRIVPDNPEKLPLEFELQHVQLEEFSFDRPAAYRATLTNPKPEGLVQAEGHFGPWLAEEPRRTPLDGRFVFKDARLDSFKGLGGTLQSEGEFEGVLQEIHVTGHAVTPDFQLTAIGQPVSLDTTFQATVDGTRGDTFLHKVDITLGASALTATGSIAGQPGAKGRTIALDATATDARLEDVLQLTVPMTEAPMTGHLGFDAAMTLPPGDAPVPSRLAVKGTFRLRDLLFTSDRVQDRVDELSRRGRGRPADASVAEVASAFEGAFALEGGVMRIPRVDFTVRGARVRLGGAYRLDGSVLDFSGVLRLDAEVSELTTGWKSVLLKAVDPLFRRDGAGTVVPIHVRGTASKPTFGVDVKRALRR